MTIEFKGLDTVLKNLNAEVKKIRFRSEKGLLKAALHIRKEAQKLCPVVTGNLKNSAFTISSVSRGFLKGAEIGSGETPNFKNDEEGDLADSHQKALKEGKGEVLAGKEPVAVVGFSAAYAAFVHENPRAGKTGGVSPKGKQYLAPMLPSGKRSAQAVFSTVGQYKFLEQPLMTEQEKILQIIRDNAEIL